MCSIIIINSRTHHLSHTHTHTHTRCCLKMSDSYIDKNTHAYYHGSGGAQQSKDGNDTRMEPVYSHKSPKTGVADEKIKLGEAIQNCESFKTPIRNMRPYGGMYRCRSSGQNRFCDMWCAVCPVCVYNVPCCGSDSCLWTIWCWLGIPLPWSFCTLFSCEMIGPSVVSRGKSGELVCQYVRLEEHEKGYGCFGAQGCDGFKTRAGLRDDTPMLLKAEPGCC